MNPDIFTNQGAEHLSRWIHFMAGVTWIGLLYYFNFVQGEYFKEATPDAKSDAVKKLAPRALWWFRYGALLTFLSGLAILGLRAHPTLLWTLDITVGALLGTLMFLNVWLIIWPNQKIICGIVPGDAAAAGPKALLASRTNVLFSGAMLLFMGSSAGLFPVMRRRRVRRRCLPRVPTCCSPPRCCCSWALRRTSRTACSEMPAAWLWACPWQSSPRSN